MYVEPKNDPALLKHLRTTDRVRAPRRLSHPLFQTARKITGIRAYCFKTRRQPTYGDVRHLGLFYENRAIYLGAQGQKDINGLLHEYCHAFVAEKRGTLDRFNYASTPEDEGEACQIELWLGFVSGYYSYDVLCDFIFGYNMEEEIREIRTEDLRQALWATPASVERFLRKCRRTALTYPWAREVAKELGVAHAGLIGEKMQPIKAAFPNI